MSQFIKTNEIYDEVAKVISGILPKYIVCVTLYNVSGIFNLNIHSFYKNQFVCLKIYLC